MADTINLEASQRIISVQGLEHYHEKAMTEVNEKIAGISGAVVDDTLSDASTNAIQNKAVTNALNGKADKSDIPKSLPADGGNAETVNGHTIQSDVPASAKFTDTTYSNFVKSGSGAKAGLVPSPPTTAGTSKYLREDGTWQTPPNNTYAAGAGLSLSGSTFSNSGVRSVATGSSNGTISVNTNGSAANVSVKGLASAAYQAVQTVAGTIGLHRISSGTAAATTTNCPAGCWYGKHA